MMPDQSYIGQELEIFARAVNWKRYFSDHIRPFIGSKVLEVGAGIGATTEILAPQECSEWVCLEPDSHLLSVIEGKIQQGTLPNFCRPVQGTLHQLPVSEKFDTILYIDVLEHIENDYDELNTASQRLSPGGKLVVLSPAHDFLFSNFDKAIGHFRRYNRQMIRSATPPELELISNKYLDAVGALTSLANKLLLGQKNPTLEQIYFWDHWLVPMSKVVDKLTGHNFGRSIIGIWKKPDG